MLWLWMVKRWNLQNELLTKLTNAENYLNAGDSLNCKTEVTAFQISVDMVYQNAEENYPKYVSDEGYKFLYYYSGYIIERLWFCEKWKGKSEKLTFNSNTQKFVYL